MRIRLQVVIEDDNEPARIAEIGAIDRLTLSGADFGLHLDEARLLLLGRLQETMVEAQVAEFLRLNECRNACGRRRFRNGRHRLVYRTAFGQLALESPRFYACRACSPGSRKSISPLARRLKERMSPELQYLQANFAGLMSYGLTVSVLNELLPLNATIAATSVRRTVSKIAARLDAEARPNRPADLPDRHDRPLIPPPHPVGAVGVDGGYVRLAGRKSRPDGWFEVMVAKTHRTDRPGKAMAYVHRLEVRPAQRLMTFLKGEGVGPFDPVTILSDGAKTVRIAQAAFKPVDEIVLDWFHIAVRLQNMIQLAKGLDPETGDEILERLKRAKWHLWHGCPWRAQETLANLMHQVEDVAETENGSKLMELLEDFMAYIDNNDGAIVNYGERYRNGEPISSSFAESAINQVVSKRFVKKQQMAWSDKGAHALLQIRTAVLNGDLKARFDRWRPSSPANDPLAARAA